VTPDVRQRARRGEGERLRGEILCAAEELLLETADESAVSIRAIADRVGVTPPSIYRHFADKDTLLFHVINNVFGELDAQLERAAVGAADPIDEVRRKCMAYVEYGLVHPEHYRLLFMCKNERKKDMDLDGPAVAGSTAFNHLMDTAERILATASPGASQLDPYAFTCAIWAGVHGITSLRISMPLFPWPSVDDQVDLLVEVWRGALCPAARGADAD
jgi:AcrR family transcriptional regulator